MHPLRPLAVERLDAAWQLLLEAFGADPGGRERLLGLLPALHAWELFDGGRTVGVAIDRPYEQWFGGRPVAMAGVADVALAAEARGGGAGAGLVRELVPRLRERGALVSTLFPSVVGLYRAAGWEVAGQLSWVRLAAAPLRRTRPASPPPDAVAMPAVAAGSASAAGSVGAPAGTGSGAGAAGVTVRRASPVDGPAVQAVYRRWAAAGNGLVDREGPLFAEPPPADPTTLVEVDGRVAGFVHWVRGTAYGPGAELTVYDLVADGAVAYQALLDQLGSWSAVTPTVRVRAPLDPAVELLLPELPEPVGHPKPWMFRVVDAAGAVAARGFPEDLHVEVDLTVVDTTAPWNDGNHHLTVTHGRGHLEPGRHGGPTVDQRALALLYASAADTTTLRRAGLLTGGDPQQRSALDQAFRGPRPVLLDAF